jgi:hypothetical protein
MIELNAEQRRLMAQGEPVRVIDPSTKDTYIVVRAEAYEGQAPQPRRTAEPLKSDIPPLMLRSQQAFWHELPELLKDQRNQGKWVAYNGAERVAFARSDVEAYKECFGRGLKLGEFYVGRLEADPEGVPPWGTLDSDWSLFEVSGGSQTGST